MTTVMHDNRARQPTSKTISTLPGTPTHHLGVTVYLAHHDAGSGLCACGGGHPCPCRRRAAELIEAAGDDPRSYDAPPQAAYTAAPPPPVEARNRDNAATALLPIHRVDQPPRTYEGYHVGGYGRPPMDQQGFVYQRDPE